MSNAILNQELNPVFKPILYTFRRCPYAIRARMALHYSGVACEMREVILKHKPQEMIELSVKATVPILQVNQELVIDESVDIIHWALGQSDSENWQAPGLQNELVDRNDTYFKSYLDRYKYYDRYPQHDQQHYLNMALVFLSELEGCLSERQPFLHGDSITWVDVAVFPFVRQFAMVDKTVFDQLPLANLQDWLEFFMASKLFTDVMDKLPDWQPQK